MVQKRVDKSISIEITIIPIESLDKVLSRTLLRWPPWHEHQTTEPWTGTPKLTIDPTFSAGPTTLKKG